MRNYFVSALFVLSFPALSWAEASGLHLLEGSEWKGTCERATSENGQPVKGGGWGQSSYSLQSGNLVTSIKVFRDRRCRKASPGWGRHTYNCTAVAGEPYANCRETKREQMKNIDGNWEDLPLVDHGGFPNVIEKKVRVTRKGECELTISTIGESDDESSESLSCGAR